MVKLFSIFLSLITFLFLTSSPTFANENFTVANDVTYTINESGMAHADFAITLKNTTTQYFASSYTINVNLDHIQNITASDPNGPIIPKVSKKDDGYLISIPFNKNYVGINKSFSFHIIFDTPDIAFHHGKIWEVNIPGIKNQNEFKGFSVHVDVPSSFGDPSFVKPLLTSLNRNNLDFNKDQLQNGGISLTFGEEQIYDFNLLYHLKNSNLFPIQTEITLPPTTNYQDVLIEKIDPSPSQVYQDKDGNWLAQFSLPPSSLKNITVKGQSRLYLIPKKQIQTNDDLKQYLNEKPYWQINNEKIKNLAQKLKTPKDIYEYVAKDLKYDFSRVSEKKPRLGALEVLNNPSSAVCLEFTDLFIALTRAAGIPAREVDGFAYTENSKQRPVSFIKDILHAWPEYYDKDLQTWIMVDPTWGNTTGVDYFNTLDLDHFAFIIKGEDSTYPIPAGGYKLTGKSESKDVDVSFAKSDLLRIEKFQIEDEIPDKIVAGFPIDGKITLKNIGNALSSSQKITIDSFLLTPHTQTLTFPNIPPFGYFSYPVKLDRTSFLTKRDVTITIKHEEKAFSKKVEITPLPLSKNGIFIIGGIIGAGILIIVILFTSTRTRNIPIYRKNGKSPLRGKG